MTEEWKAIKGYEERYLISNIGRVKSLIGHEKILSTSKNRYGYLYVALCKDKKRKLHTIHRLVACGFIPNPNNKPQVNHIDGNKTNNHVDNLEWCTNSENIKHAYKTGLNKGPVGELQGNHKLTWEDVHWIRKHYVKRSYDFNTYTIARKYSIDPKEVNDIIHNRIWVEE